MYTPLRAMPLHAKSFLYRGPAALDDERSTKVERCCSRSGHNQHPLKEIAEESVKPFTAKTFKADSKRLWELHLHFVKVQATQLIMVRSPLLDFTYMKIVQGAEFLCLISYDHIKPHKQGCIIIIFVDNSISRSAVKQLLMHQDGQSPELQDLERSSAIRGASLLPAQKSFWKNP